jgi:hypothetical protein
MVLEAGHGVGHFAVGIGQLQTGRWCLCSGTDRLTALCGLCICMARGVPHTRPSQHPGSIPVMTILTKLSSGMGSEAGTI